MVYVNAKASGGSTCQEIVKAHSNTILVENNAYVDGYTLTFKSQLNNNTPIDAYVHMALTLFYNP